MKALGKTYNDAEARTDGFERLPAGGYVCKITEVKDVTASEYLQVVYDIAEGPYKGFYGDDWGKEHPKAHSLFMSYKEKALGMFKGFTNAVEGSNKGYKWDWNEKALEGKLIGLVLGEEEYIKNDGSVATRLKVRSNKTIDEIKDGRFRVPKLKKLSGGSEASTVPAGFQPVESDMPF